MPKYNDFDLDIQHENIIDTVINGKSILELCDNTWYTEKGTCTTRPTTIPE